MISINANFDGGNIEPVSTQNSNDIQVKIRKDNAADFLQWFYFRLSGVEGQDCKVKFLNAGECSYTKGWEGYRVVVSEDRKHWRRVDTDFDGKIMTAHVTPKADAIYLAYFAPYSLERTADVTARAMRSSRVRHKVLGQSLDGQDIDLLTIGEAGPDKKPLWFIARQHPGETQGGWWMEAFLERMTDRNDAVANRLLEKSVIYVVPNINPDGSRRGNLRTNAVGANLNREWQNPTLERSPEVYHVRAKMQEVGNHFCLDVHGDEGLPYNFIAGYEGIPSLDDNQLEQLNAYRDELARIFPDFQTKNGYPKASPGKGNLTTSTGHLAEEMGTVALTLEMPFKDNADRPDQDRGWSPMRCKLLARACIDALGLRIDDLKPRKV